MLFKLATKKLNTRIKNKRDLECNWQAAHGFTPLEGELVVYSKELDRDQQILTKADGTLALPSDRVFNGAYYCYDRLKVGDGFTNVSDLPFINTPSVFTGVITGKPAHQLYANKDTIFIAEETLNSPNYSATISITNFQLMPVGNKIQQIFKFKSALTGPMAGTILNGAVLTFSTWISADSETSSIDCPIMLVKPNLYLSGWTFDLTPISRSTNFDTNYSSYGAEALFQIHTPLNTNPASNDGVITTNTSYVVRLTFEKIDNYTVLVDPELFITGDKI